MKHWIINWCLEIVQKNKKYSKDELEQIEYGLLSIYLLVTKLVIILILCAFLGILKEAIIFLIIYNIMRMPSFGIHASKSWICLVCSTIIFVGVPYISLHIEISPILKYIIGILGIINIYAFSPADTHKRPIINPTRRKVYKLLSTFIAIVYIILSFVITNNFISNCFIFAVIAQCITISPITYKIFNMPYNNYKLYIENPV
ncbi:MAG: accessory gene regulator B family protein [Clostridium sp.]|nr:accessory gene regulator B family protein [Clostridium sp.]MCM1443917.1 accessory gene regulator B family protein [Candidatus Amulumruptor caecigallinarius]